MKIALINPLNFQENLIKRNEVLSLMYLKQFLKEKGYTADIVELKMEDDVDLEKQDFLWVNEYDIIGISCYYPFTPLELAYEIRKQNVNVLLFAGGPMASLLYRELLFEGSPLDAIIVNEGEYSLFELIRNYDLVGDIRGIQGVALFQEGKIAFTRRPFEENIDNFPYPQRDRGYFDKFIPTVISSRGCNGRCAFCSTRYTGNWRGRSPLNVYSEIKDIVLQHDQRHFQFVEPNFLHDGIRAQQIAELIGKLPCRITFDFACRIDSIIQNQSAVSKLKEAGAIKVLLGIENFSDKVLKEWEKDITCSQIEEAIKILRKNKLAFSVSLILFHPNVSVEELIFNVDEIEKLGIINDIENIYNALILIPGTKMNMTTKKKEWEYRDEQIYEIHNICIKYKMQLEKNGKDYSASMIDYKYLFEVNAFYKWYELNKLKELLGLSIQNKKIDKNSFFVLNPKIRIQMKGEIGDCINGETGFVFQVDNTLIEVLKYIKNKNVFWVIQDITGVGKEYKFEKNKIVEIICFLLKNRFILIGERVNEKIHNAEQ